MTFIVLSVIFLHLMAILVLSNGSSICNFDQQLSTQELSLLQPCGKDFCRCNKTFAICAEYGRNLTYIPRLEDSIESLNFSFNYFPRELDYPTFHNLSTQNIKYLWLQGNDISSMTRFALYYFYKLEFLDLRQNEIYYDSATFASMNEDLRCLAFSQAEIGVFAFLQFSPYQLLESLILTRCDLVRLNFHFTRNLPSLQFLDVSFNNLQSISFIFPLPLLHLKASVNNFKLFPSFCEEVSNLVLEKLELSHNKIETVSYKELKCLTALTHLSLGDNRITSIQSNVISCLPKLNVLNLDNFYGKANNSQKIRAYAFNDTTLSQFSLQSLPDIFKRTVDKYAFKGCKNLQTLLCGHNKLESAEEEYLSDLLGDMHRLEVLKLDNCHLTSIPDVVTKLLNIRELDLSSNKITILSDSSFNTLHKLSIIILADNQIVTLHNTVFPLVLQNQLKHINLCNNPFLCTCEILWFIKWLKKDPKKFLGNPDYYRCEYSHLPKSLPMINAPISAQICSLSPTVVNLIVSLSGFTVICIVVVSVLYKRRWHIRYYIHMLRYKRKHRHEDIEENDFRYDAFVLFCDDNFRFVRDRLMPEIEDNGQMRLCVHQRDFTPGTYIVDNIVDSLENSRNVILILSNTFSESSWCEFELALVQKRALEKQEGYLVVILLEDLEARNMTASLYALLQTTTYIMWPEEEEDRELFWQRVKAGIEQ